jgi:hypothetical protein
MFFEPRRSRRSGRRFCQHTNARTYRSSGETVQRAGRFCQAARVLGRSSLARPQGHCPRLWNGAFQGLIPSSLVMRLRKSTRHGRRSLHNFSIRALAHERIGALSVTSLRFAKKSCGDCGIGAMGKSSSRTERHYAYLAPKNLGSAVARLEKSVMKLVITPEKGNSSKESHKPNGIRVPKGGVEPPWYQVPRDFESRASASSATSASKALSSTRTSGGRRPSNSGGNGS